MVNKSNVFCTVFLFLFALPVFVNAQEIQSSSAESYEKGISVFDAGLYESVPTELSDFLNQHNNHDLSPSALFYLLRAKTQSDSVNARAYYGDYMYQYPQTIFTSNILFELGHEAERDSAYSQAGDYYQRAINLGLDDENEARTYYWLAESQAKEKQYAQARANFLTLADDHPRSKWAPKALFARGRLYLAENKYDSSSVAFKKLKNRYPNSKIARRIGTALGASYYQQGQYKLAIKALKDALPNLDGEPKTKAVYLIAESYNYLNKLDEASDYYLQYINRTKGTSKERSAHYGLGWVYHKQEIYHWARDEFEKAAKGSDKLARKALYYKAVNEKLGSRYRASMNSFRSFGKKYKKGVWVEKTYYEWAVTAYEVGRYVEAIEALLPLVRSDEPLDWKGKVFTLLGKSYFANKEYTRAMQAFEEAEKVTDVDPAIERQAKFQKAWLLYNNQAYKKSQTIFERINDNWPQTKLGEEALFWSADSYYNMEDYGPASSQFSSFIKRYPDHKLSGPANYSLGWSNFKLGRYQKAISPFQNFKNNYKPPEKALYPYDTDTQLRIADSYYAVSDYSKAISSYQEEVGSEPGGDYALFQIGNSYYRAQKSYDAVKTFRKFLRIYPQSKFSEQAQYNIAYIYLNTENYSQAVKEFHAVINKYPKTQWAARAQYNIGDAYYNAGDYQKAIAAYKEVMKKYPDSEYIIEAADGIQYAQVSAGKTDSSSAVLQDFLADNPQTSMADRLRYRQADNRMQTGNYQAAIKGFKQYLRITNKEELQPDAHFNLANAYEQTKQRDKAIEEYETIVADFPTSDKAASALVALGRIAHNQQRYQQSFNYYKKLKKKGRKYKKEALIGMGNAQLKMGNRQQAARQYQAVLKINSDSDAATVGLAKVQLQDGKYGEAQKQLSKVAESNTTEVGAEAQYLLGMALQKQRSYSAAVEAYSKVNVLYKAFDQWIAKSMLKQGICYIKMDKKGKARSTLESLTENYPDSPQAKEADKILGGQ